MSTIATPIETLVAGYRRAQRTWGPGHVIHVDERGYVYLHGRPGDRETAELTVDDYPLRRSEAAAGDGPLDAVARPSGLKPTSRFRPVFDVGDPPHRVGR